jgi:hypothetical protein
LKQITISLVQKLLQWLAAILCTSSSLAQQPAWRVQISKDLLVPGDTVDMLATYNISGRALPPATFAVTLVNADSSRIWQMRWPMIGGESDASFVIPEKMPPGNYYLMMALQPRALRLFGEIKYPSKRMSEMRGYVESGEGASSLEIPVSPQGRFEVDSIFFEGPARIQFFNPTNSDPEYAPMVTLEAWLDSLFEPPAFSVKHLIVQDVASEANRKTSPIDKNAFYASGFGGFSSRFPMEQAIQKMKAASDSKIFDSLFVPVTFKSDAYLTLNTFTDTSWKKYATVYEWLKAKLKNIQVTRDLVVSKQKQNGRGSKSMPAIEALLMVNGDNYRLWADGSYGSIHSLLRNPAEIGIIRIYNPLSPLAREQTNEPMGIIAFFERKYPFVLTPPVKNSYIIRGYTPAYYRLPL